LTIKLSLIKKISFLVASAILISQLTQMVFFEYFLKQNYTKEAINKIKYAANIIQVDMTKTEDELKEGVAFINSDEAVLASLYFINNYQDKQNYNAILLDEEKKRISQQLLYRVKLSLNDIIAFYDTNRELIAYVIKKPKGYQQNFVSYVHGNFTIYSKYEHEKNYSIKKFNDQNFISLHHLDYYPNEPIINSAITYHNVNNSIVIKSHRSIMENNIIIGHIELDKLHEDKYFKQISKQTDLKIYLTDITKQHPLSSIAFNDKKTNLTIEETEHNIFSTVYIDTLKKRTNLVLELNKKYLEVAIFENRIKSFSIGIITIISILLVLFILLTKGLIIPLEKLMKQIKKIESKDYSKTTVLETNDELEVISNNINNLASTIQKREIRIQEEVENNIKIQEQLFKSEKLASMGEMIGNIAHQWRQPLSVISTASTGMKMQKEFDTLTDENFIHSCDLINDNAQYLSKTIDDFRNFIKGNRKKELFNIKDDIKSFLHLVEGPIKNHNINLILNLEDNIEMNGYKNELIQCLINIFNNAKDVLRDKETKYIFLSTSTQENNAVITIKDNGGGIPEDILPRIFEPYFTTKHQSQGTGLGLHMTYNLIVDGMHGTIEASNVNYEYEKKHYTGAEFTITLPLS